jgi:hypothetical protein
MSEPHEPGPKPPVGPEARPTGGDLPPKTDAGVGRGDRAAQPGMRNEGGEAAPDAGGMIGEGQGQAAAEPASGMLNQGGDDSRDAGGMLGEG